MDPDTVGEGWIMRFPKRSSMPLTEAREVGVDDLDPGGGIPVFLGLSEYGARFSTEEAAGAAKGPAVAGFENEAIKSSISMSAGGAGAKLETAGELY